VHARTYAGTYAATRTVHAGTDAAPRTVHAGTDVLCIRSYIRSSTYCARRYRHTVHACTYILCTQVQTQLHQSLSDTCVRVTDAAHALSGRAAAMAYC
jgi:hypothetical protein